MYCKFTQVEHIKHKIQRRITKLGYHPPQLGMLFGEHVNVSMSKKYPN
jgi:hypothetical protein